MSLRTPAGTRWAGAVLTVAGAVIALTGCTPAPATAPTPSPSAPSSSAAAPSPSPTSSASTPEASATPTPTASETEPGALTIAITIAGGKVQPNGEKIKLAVGQKVVLNVTSDEDDEIHAHIGEGDGYELEVQAGKSAKGSFTIGSPGSYEIESHHLGKTIVILNVR